jgi:hypothetical protein
MKFPGTILLALAVTALPSLAESTPAAHNFPLTVQVDSIEMESAGTSSLVLRVQGHVSAPQSVRIKRLSFDQMQLGSLPLHAAPIEQPIDLERDKSVELPPVLVTVYYRDVNSLEPLRQAVSDGQARIRSTAHADLDLNFFQRLMSGLWSSQAEVPVDITVPVHVAGGNAGKAAALAALDAADLALRLGSSVFHILGVAKTAGDADPRLRSRPALVESAARMASRAAELSAS